MSPARRSRAARPTQAVRPSPAGSSRPSPAQRPSRAAWRLFSLIGLSMVLASMNFSVIFVAFGEITESFSAEQTTVSWTLTAFSITLGALIVPGGWAADRYGRATVFLAGFGVFVCGSALVAAAPSVELLIAARVVQAAGLAFETPAALAIVLHAFPEQRRATAVGAMGGLGGIAAALGPVVGGALVDSIGWRWTFFANIPIGLAIIAVISARLPRDRPQGTSGPPDLAGAALIIASVAALILGIVQSPDWGFLDPRTAGTLAVAVLGAAALVLRSRDHRDPILCLPLFAISSFRLGSILQVLIAGSFAGIFLSQIRFLDAGWGLSLFEAGLVVALIPALAGPLTVVSGRIADRYGHRLVILPGTVLMAASALLFLATVDAERDLWAFVGANLVYAAGVGFAHAACQSTAVRDVPKDRLGIGAGMARIAMEVGLAVSAALAVTLMDSADSPAEGLHHTMIYLLVLSLAALPLTLRLPRAAP